MSLYTQKIEEYGDQGTVKAVYHPVVVVDGLDDVRANEMVVFENGVFGRVMSLSENRAEILLFSHYPVRVGQRLARTGENLQVPVGAYMLGHIIDSLGRPLLSIDDDDTTTLTTELEESFDERKLQEMAEAYRPIDIRPPGMLSRREVVRPFLTGVSVVDTMLPLGHGQREMVVGDRKTGKTSFLLTAMKTHALRGGVVIYVAIGKKSIEIEDLRNFVITERILENVLILATTSHDAASLIFTAPYTGMTIAEHFCDKQQDVLLILDDLSTHAKYYREISLQAHRFPGRDSYPGDIFFTHAKLLERAGNYIKGTGEAAITCLPVAETTENDLSDYIVSNLIGITDGHILFDYTEFLKGRRPSVNASLSVTRVGKQTQSSLHQVINSELLAFMIKYERSKSYSHFGAELSRDIQKMLTKGDQILSFFQQPPELVVPLPVQIFFLGYIMSIGDVDFKGELEDLRRFVCDLYQSDQHMQTLIGGAVEVDSLEKLKKNTTVIMPEVTKLWQAAKK